jgi:hypothetical protein
MDRDEDYFFSFEELATSLKIPGLLHCMAIDNHQDQAIHFHHC